jgi:hypothetical protein
MRPYEFAPPERHAESPDPHPAISPPKLKEAKLIEELDDKGIRRVPSDFSSSPVIPPRQDETAVPRKQPAPESSSKRDVEVIADKLKEAFADDIGGRAADIVFSPPAESDESEAFPTQQAADDIETIIGWLQGAVTSVFEASAAEIGLPSGEAAISAGVFSELVLAPIMGPLEEAAILLEIAGLIAGLATGTPALALTCLKALEHKAFEHAVSRIIIGLAQAPGAHDPESAARTPAITYMADVPLTRPPSADTLPVRRAAELDRAAPARPVENAAPNPPRKTTRDDPLWLCLELKPRSPDNRNKPAPGIYISADVLTDVRSTVVLPAGDDEFLRTLPEILERSAVSTVDEPCVKTIRDLAARWHVIFQTEGIDSGTIDPQPAPRLGYQHPDCSERLCTPPGVDCPCGCIACQYSYNPIKFTASPD